MHLKCRLRNGSQIAKFMGPTWGPPGSCRPQMGHVGPTNLAIRGCSVVRGSMCCLRQPGALWSTGVISNLLDGIIHHLPPQLYLSGASFTDTVYLGCAQIFFTPNDVPASPPCRSLCIWCGLYMYIIQTNTLTSTDLGPYSLSGKTSYRKISGSLEAARFGFKSFQSLWDLTGTSAVAIWYVQYKNRDKILKNYSVFSDGFL